MASTRTRTTTRKQEARFEKTRKVVERQREKDYSTGYKLEREKRQELPNNFPHVRVILFKDLVRNPTLYQAIGLFVSIQVIIAILASAKTFTDIAGALNVIALVLGVLVVTGSLWLVHKRQSRDRMRRRARLWRVPLVVLGMFALIIATTAALTALGVQPGVQPNQASLDVLVGLFPFVMIFTMVVVSPVVEELVFRELLPYALGASYLSFILSSLVFMLLHAPSGAIGWTSYGILSAGFLYMRLKDNNLYGAILAHIAWNALTLIL